ncbi:MAG TPA: DUF5597 domain-containing protein [Lacunisphaera sp.]|nr:DUF5597 domain-containing protein [Lacunisphaera sp.]
MNLFLRSLIVVFLLVPVVSHAEDARPHLARQGTATQLWVDGRPFLARAGELGNSSGEPAYLHPFWPKLKAMNLNTVLAPVYWERIEPAEGKFDFSTLDGLLQDARASDMRLVLLWFGAWKNSMSSYAPAWVKTNYQRFPRCRDSAGRALEILSPFSAENRATDARAFAAVLQHLREVDGQAHTVVLVQVENEIGMIPEARDHSPEADQLFKGPVPAELMAHLAGDFDALAPELRDAWVAQGRRPSGTWTEIFGPGVATDEIFSAWYFARFIDALATAGKAAYPLPMYVNAALIRPGHLPGQYPSAGPLPQVADVWRAGAPSLDFLAPDIYFTNFSEWARRYTRHGNPLFIPESVRAPDGSANAFYAFGGLDAIGFSPFGIEYISELGAKYLTGGYAVIAQLTPLITANQGRGTMAGMVPEGPEQRQPQQVWLGGYTLQVAFDPGGGYDVTAGNPAASPPPASPTGGLVIATGQDEFLLAGIGITTTFQLRGGGGMQVGLLSVEEGEFVDGQWRHIRWLNGDQTNQGRHVRLEPGRFSIQRVRLYQFK